MRRAEGMFVSGAFFEMLGVTALQGRVFSRSDDDPACGMTAVVSSAFWRRELRHRSSGCWPRSSRGRLRVHHRRCHTRTLHRDRGRSVLRCRAAVVRRTGIRWSEQPACGTPVQLLAVGDRPASRRVDDRAGHRAPAEHLAPDLRDHPSSRRGRGRRATLHRDVAPRGPRGEGCVVAASGLRARSVAAAGVGRAGAADRLRKSGQPAAGARPRQIAGDCGSPRGRRLEGADRPVNC